MTGSPDWVPVKERWQATLVRTVGLALIVGAGASSMRRDYSLIPLATMTALWFTLGGHFIELSFRNRMRQLISPHRAMQALARLAWWFAGGVVLMRAAVTVWSLVSSREPTIWVWWVGGVLFVFLELTVHVLLWATRQPSFFNGRG